MSRREPVREYDVPRIHPDLDDYVVRWTEAAATFRDQVGGDLDVPYGPSDTQRIDFFAPDDPADALVLFFHGGFWVEGDRKLYSHLALGPVGRGLAVGIAGYDLAPDVGLGDIVEEAKAAVRFAAEHSSLPVVVAGHSAGGHLTAMVIADATVPASHGVAVSGIFDLEPFLDLPLNKLLRLDAVDARRLSPIHLEPPDDVTLALAVGAEEPPEFHWQSQRMAERWPASGASIDALTVPERQHLTVIEELADPEGMLASLCRAAAERAIG